MKAFFDPQTRVLKCFGHVQTNEPGDIAVDVPDGFFHEIGAARLGVDGESIEPYSAPLPVPQSVTPLQARRALRQLGLSVAVESHVATLSDDARDTWEYALSIERNHPVVQSSALALGKSDADMDQLFRLASTL